MSRGVVRPRFRLALTGSVASQIRKIEDAAGRASDRCDLRVLGNHVDLATPSGRRHFWSPCVQLEFAEENASGGERTMVNGLVGPHPNRWTLFMFINVHIALIGGAALMLGLVQLSLGASAWALWIAAVGVLGLAFMYGVSQLGRRLGAEQTRQLLDVVEDAFGGLDS